MKKGAPEERPGRLYLSSVFERAKEFELSPSERLVLVSLFRYLGGKDYCFPSQQSLAMDTGLSSQRVRTLLKELAEKGIIEIAMRQPTGRNHRNHAHEYRFKFLQNEGLSGNLKQAKAEIYSGQKLPRSWTAMDERIRNISKECIKRRIHLISQQVRTD
jgi:hypothetical protein